MRKICKILAILALFLGSVLSITLIGSGGILPYITKKNSIYFLLAKESDDSNINRWGPFAQGSYKGEIPTQTVAKKGSQELMNVMSSRYLFNKISTTKYRCNKSFIINISDQGDRREIINRLDTEKRRLLSKKNQKKEFRWFSRGRLIKAIEHNEWWLDKNFKNRFRNCIPLLHKIKIITGE